MPTSAAEPWRASVDSGATIAEGGWYAASHGGIRLEVAHLLGDPVNG